MMDHFPWHGYSKKCRQKILNPRNFGRFTLEDATARKMHYAMGKSGAIEEGNCLVLHWLVDLLDGTIVDCKFQCFGEALLIAVAEVTCELVVGKNYDQAKRITAELIERMLRDKKEQPACKEGHLSHLNRAVDAIEEAAALCKEIALPTSYVTPIVENREEASRCYPGWEGLTKERKLLVIEEIFTEEIRPYIELDEGGVKILELKNEREVVIAYEGACTSCYSSIGTTLSSIQHILRTKVHPSLTVTPNLDGLALK